MGLASRLASLAALAAWAIACSGKSTEDPPPPNTSSQMACLTSLSTYCCGDGGSHPCVQDFAVASECATWPAGSSVQVYATPCKGLKAVRLVGTWSTFYVYDATTSQLISVNDNASTVKDPRDVSIGCGAGPTTFTVPDECGPIWLGTAGATACTSGSAAAPSYCVTH